MAQPVTITQVAINLLYVAATKQPDEQVHFSEARGIWQPNTWLLQRCWNALADAGYGDEAIVVAQLARTRQALAPLQALHKLAGRVDQQPDLDPFLQEELRDLRLRLLAADVPTVHATEYTNVDSSHTLIDSLLYAAAASAYLPDPTSVFVCLERLDQLPRAWDRIFVQPDMRLLLAETVARVGLHPLTRYLIDAAIRRFSDSGAQFLQQVAISTSTVKNGAKSQGQTTGPLPLRQRRVLDRCATTLRNATLLSLHSRRIAAVVMARAGRFDEMIGQLDTIATIQDAHRETGFTHHAGRTSGATYTAPTYTVSTYTNASYGRGGTGAAASRTADSTVGSTGGSTADRDDAPLRQVTRSRSDADVDFQVHTLQNAIEVLPLGEILPQQRGALSARMAELSGRSDGWTAAGAVSSLLKLGDIASAIAVANSIPPPDPTRSEVLIALVEGLLCGGHHAMALEQVNRAMAWAKSLPERTPERALTWGLAAAFLDQGQPGVALQLLGEPAEPGWGERMGQLLRGQWPGGAMTDDTLRTDRLRLRAQLQASHAHSHQPGTNGTAVPPTDLASELPPETDALLRRLCSWAPRLLDGETLVNFYVDGILRPLLGAGKVRHAWGLLPQLQEALLTLRGAKFAPNLARLLDLMVDPLTPLSPHYHPDHAAAMQRLLEEFVVALWQAKAEHGIWQAVYSLDGSLPLLLHLRGSVAVMEIAHVAADARWGE